MPLPRLRRRSFGLIAGAVLVFAVGTNVQAGWLFVLASLLLAVAVAGWLLPARMIRGVQVRREAPTRAYQGDEVAVDVVVTADARHAPLSLSVLDPFMAPTRLFVRRLGRGERSLLTTYRKALRRGPVEGVAVELASSGPFGVATASRTVPAEGRTLVYPSVVALDWFPGVDGRSDQGALAASTHRRGPGQDYLGIREYRPGDSPRHVHWPSSARHGGLMVREFEQERPRRLAILVDTSADAVAQAQTPLDACCSAAASVALLALGRGQPVDLCAAKHGALDVLRDPAPSEALEWLALLVPDGGLRLAEAASQAAAVLGPDRVGVLALPTWEWNGFQEVGAALGALGGHDRRPVAVVVDAGSFRDATQPPEEVRADGNAAGVDVLSAEGVEALLRALSAGPATVLHVTAGGGLEDSLAQLSGIEP